MGNCLQTCFAESTDNATPTRGSAPTNMSPVVPQSTDNGVTAKTPEKAPVESSDAQRGGGRRKSRRSTGTREKGIVVLDSGTGESKIIFVCEDENGNVKVEEMKQLASLKGLHVAEDKEASMNAIAEALADAVKSKPDAGCYVGLTAWFRDKKTTEAEKDFVREFFKARAPQFDVLELRGDEEAMFEASAVNYAATKSNLGKPQLQLAAGGGSINLVFEDEPYNIQTGFRAGQSVLMEKGVGEVSNLEEQAKKQVDEFLKEHGKFKEKGIEGPIIAISACYYAAKGTGIATDEAQLASHIVYTFEKRKKELVEGIAEGAKPEKKVAQEIANMILQKELFKRLCTQKAKVFFRRDWKINGVAFRTTWTSGFFIKDFHEEPKGVDSHPWKHKVSQSLSSTELRSPSGEHRVKEPFGSHESFNKDVWPAEKVAEKS